MKYFKTIAFSFFIIFSVLSCSMLSNKMFSDEQIKLARKDYFGSLRLDGYYYKKLDSIGDRISIRFLYKNGIAIYGEAPGAGDLLNHENNFENGSYYERIKSIKYYWGVYEETNQFKMESWAPSSGGGLKTVVRLGEVIEDNRFVINSVFSNYSGETTVENDTFHFKSFSPKPDSTNVFIK